MIDDNCRFLTNDAERIILTGLGRTSKAMPSGDQRKPPSYLRIEARPPLPSGAGINAKHTIPQENAGDVTRARGAASAQLPWKNSIGINGNL